MKVCSTCGETYKPHIDFCFADGDVLQAAPNAMDAPMPGGVATTEQDADNSPPDVVEEFPDVVPVEPPSSAPEAEAPAEGARPRRGTIVPGLGSEELAAEAEAAAANEEDTSDPTTLPTDVPLAPPSAVVTDTPKPTPPQPLHTSPVPTPQPGGTRPMPDEGMDRTRVLFAAVALLFFVVAGGGALVAIFGVGTMVGRDAAPTVVEPVVRPKVVPPTPAPLAAPEAAPAEDGAGTDEGDTTPEGTEPTDGEVGTDEEGGAEGAPEDVGMAGGVDEGDEGGEGEAAPEPEGAPAPEPAPAPETAPEPAPEAAPEPMPAPESAPAPAPAPAPEPAPATDGGEGDVWGGGEAAPEPEPAAAAAAGPVMIFFAGRVGDAVAIDGKPAGILPAKANLSQGQHTFTIDGAAGKVVVVNDVVLNADGKTTILQLSAD